MTISNYLCTFFIGRYIIDFSRKNNKNYAFDLNRQTITGTHCVLRLTETNHSVAILTAFLIQFENFCKKT